MKKLQLATAILMLFVAQAGMSETVKISQESYVVAGENSSESAQASGVKGPDEAIAKNPMTYLEPGKSVATQMAEIAKNSGWQLQWEAADFHVDQRVVISADFAKAMETIIQSANQGDARLRAVFYNGNHIVRVTDL